VYGARCGPATLRGQNGVNGLVDGTSTAGWHGYNGQSLQSWTIDDCALKWKGAPDYGKARTGRIAIQDHGSVFWFRNVKIRPIPG
jgi:hypothetical protein